MLPMLQREIVENHRWATKEDLLDFFAIAQCLPGIIAINTAALAGRKIKGVAGGIAAAFGVILPSFLIIVVIAAFIRNFTENTIVNNAFFGIRIAVAALILDTIIKLFKSNIKDKVTLAMFIIAFISSIVWGVSPIYLILFAIVSGIIVSRLKLKIPK